MLQLIQQAVTLHQQGRLADAEQLYRDALRTMPQDFSALHMLGILKLQQGHAEEALRLIGAAIEIDQNSTAAHSNRGLALVALKRHQEALESFDLALAIDPRNAVTHSSRADAFRELGQTAAALRGYDLALEFDPRLVSALINRGVLLRELGRLTEALADNDAALVIAPDDAEAWNNKGVVLHGLGRVDEALSSYERAILLRPDYIDALLNRGNVLLMLRRPADAMASYQRALTLRPDLAEGYSSRGHALYDLGQFEEALASYDVALKLNPGSCEAAINRARTLCKLDRHEEALSEYEQLRRTKPATPNLAADLAYCRAVVCQWTGNAPLIEEITASALDGTSAVDPFMFLSFDSTEAQQLVCARNWLRLKKVAGTTRSWNRGDFPTDKIRIAYLSADYHRHATAHLIAELFEIHDRSRFEIVGVSFGPDDRSHLRSRVVKSFDRFFDVAGRSDADVARLLRGLKTQIAVDLKGHTTDSRIGIFADRAAPVQVAYLGYPGTTAADFIDYVIADRVTVPFEKQSYYTERIVHLPDSYQVNDSKREIGARIPSRHEVGLPDDAFVFCCFNNNFKINERMFDVWMRLLKAVEKSVLWLFASNSLTPVNLRREAQARGIDPSRLIFASPLDLPDHLARHRLADLFLDTVPYNAHTTASDSLWAGVPVVTCLGETFAGRVAASLLHAVALPELVAPDLKSYEQLAFDLAMSASRLHALRARLERHGRKPPLFDSDRFRRHLEAAYSTMWETWARGEGPRSFSVDPMAVD